MENTARIVFFNEIDFTTGEVRRIKLNPVFIAGIRDKFVKVDPEPSGLASMACTVIDYNGREILVVERFIDVVQAVAFENAHYFWHDNAKYALPDKLRQVSDKLKIIQEVEPKVVSRDNSPCQCESGDKASDL
jgi:hypothetical protein